MNAQDYSKEEWNRILASRMQWQALALSLKADSLKTVADRYAQALARFEMIPRYNS